MNGLTDPLYSVYAGKKLVKELWESIEWKYKIEDASRKKFFIFGIQNFHELSSRFIDNFVENSCGNDGLK